MEVAQLNVRIDAQVKREGDAALARMGMTATEAVRALWSYLAKAGGVPSFMTEQDVESATSTQASHAGADGAGMALTLARAQGLAGTVEETSYDELRDLAFEELIAEGIYHV